MLYAVYRGNMVLLIQKLVKLYKRLGGDFSIVNAQGLGPMHAAAQGDRMRMMAYFADLG